MVWAEMMSMSTPSEYNNVIKSTKRVKEHFDIDFTCCTSCCSYDDYDW